MNGRRAGGTKKFLISNTVPENDFSCHENLHLGDEDPLHACRGADFYGSNSFCKCDDSKVDEVGRREYM